MKEIAETSLLDEVAKEKTGSLFVVLTFTLSPLLLPFILFIIANILRKPLPLFSAILAYSLGVVLFCASYALFRLLHFGAWKAVVLRYRERYSRKGGATDSEETPPLSIFSMSGELALAEELVEAQSSFLESLRRKYGRSSTSWRHADELLLPLKSTSRFAEYISGAYKGKVKDAIRQSGMLFVYFRWEGAAGIEVAERFRLLSALASRINEVVQPFEGNVCRVAAGSLAVVFTGDWTNRETAIRTVKAGQAVSSVLADKAEEGMARPDGFVVADYCTLIEGVVSSGSVLRYFAEAELVSAYYNVVPIHGEHPLTISARLVEMIRGGDPGQDGPVTEKEGA